MRTLGGRLGRGAEHGRLGSTDSTAERPGAANQMSDPISGHEPALDEATRPRAPRHDDAVGTASGRAAGQLLVGVHAHLRSELEQLRDIVAEVAVGRSSAALARSLINEMSMRQNYWSLGAFCATYCRLLTIHHALEDANLFVDLKARDGELAPVIERLSQEHEVVAAVLTRLDAALVAMVDDADHLSSVQVEVERLADILLSHLAYEEQELLGPIARLGITF
jgi:Hemerythrin HHE cation binding domain